MIESVNVMRFPLLLAAVWLGLLGDLSPVLAAERWKDTASQLDELVPTLIEKHKTPGVSIALIDQGQIVWVKGYGVRNAETKEPVDEMTVFEACSMSKPLFAYAVLKLVEQGKLDLDRPLIEYLDEPYLKEEPLHQKITARMVLAHTSGFPNWRKGKPLTVAFEPGSDYRYSGEGFVYLQRVVEKITGQPMEDWLEPALLAPLKMSHSSYVWQPKYDQQASAGHTKEGTVKTNRNHFTKGNSAFTLYTTPSDYARFLIEMTKSDRSRPHSLTQESIAAMLTPQIDVPDSEKTARGLGWVLSTDPAKPIVSHSGSNGTGFRCYSQFHRTDGSGIVIMTNGVNGRSVWEAIMESLAADDR